MYIISIIIHVAVGPNGESVPALKSAADSLLPIVQSQRERFRLRAQELEAVCNFEICLHTELIDMEL